ncbi:MAG: hypothetical protein ACYS80_10150 [Planctomycetota bacterium]|jgi:hypothetical protein
METEFRISIELNNGQKVRYKTKVAEEEAYNLGSRIENALKANYFGLEMDGKLTIIPTQGIQKIEIEPPPEVLIAHVVRNAQPIEHDG